MKASDSPELKFPKKSKQTVIDSKTFKAGLKEIDLQRQEEEYLKLTDFAVIRVPDAAYRAIFANNNIPGHVKKLIAEFLRGIPDLVILKPVKGTNYNIAICIENKVGKNKLSQGQKKFAQNANVNVVRNFDEFMELLAGLNVSVKYSALLCTRENYEIRKKI